MWEAIERLQQGESLNIQDVKTNLFWEFGKFTSHDGESMESYYMRFYKLMNEMIRNNLIVATMQVNIQFLQQLQPEWSRFVTIVKQQHKLDEVSYHKLFDILKQYQNEVNELRAEKLARNANPLALVATAQASQDPYYQTPRSHKSSAPSPKPSIPSRSQTTTKHKGKEIAKPITPPSETASEEDIDPKQAQRDKDMQKNLVLIAKYFKKIYKPTNNNLKTSLNSKNKNVNTTPRFKNDNQSGQFRNQRTINVVVARKNVRSKVVQQSGIQCFNCKEYRHFAKECRKPKRVKDFTYHKEKMLMCKQAEQGVLLQAEQYDWLANTDEEVDEQELEAHYSYMAKIQEVPTADSDTDSEPVEQNDQNDVESDDERVALANLIANLKLDVDENKKIQRQLKKANTTLAQELKECKAILTKTSKSLGESISVRDSCLVALQTKQAEFEKFKAFNDCTVDYDKLERKLNEALGQLAHKGIVIREDQFRAPTAHDMEILIQTCLMPFAIKTQSDSLKFVHELKQEMHADLKYVESLEKEIDELESEKAEFSDMYDVILQECVKECDCLAQKLSKQTDSVSKKVHTKLLQRFDKLEKHLISLEIALQKSKEQVNNDTVCNEKASNVFRKEREQYFKIQDLKSKLQDKNIAISELKKLIEKGKGKSVDTKFDRPSVVRQPNAQRISKPSFLGVNHKPTVSRPQLKSNQSKDKVLLNNSQVKAKKTQVEVHPRIPSVSNKTKSVTTCKDNLNSKTLNANVVYATCNKCLIDSNHFACVTKMLNDMHARTKKPIVVPISTRKSKSQANKSIATPNKKKVASKSTNQKPHSYFRVMYENTNKAWKWWIERQSPSGYKWVPKPKKQWVPKAKKPWIVQLILFTVDSGCTKHMTDNLKLLCNFIKKFLGTVRFSNDQFAPSLGYGDLVQGNVTIKRVYYVEGLNHNLFSVGQFCDADLKVDFRKLSRLNFDYINLLSKKDIVIGLPKLKFVKDQLCSSCELSKAKRSSFKSKVVSSSKGRLNLLHMDLCGPMRVASINGKKYILVVVDDYSRYTGTEFLNKILNAFFKEEGIEHQTSTARTPEQNGVVERWNHADAPSQQELDLLFGPLYDEFFNACTNPSTNVQSTLAPSTHTNVHAEENNNDQAREGEQLQDDEFTNPFCAPTQEQAESSSHNIGLQIHQSPSGIFINQAKYTLEILHKHGMDKVQSIGTPMVTKPKLDANLSGNPVDQTDYRNKIGSLMYLTSSRPNIVQAGSSFELTAFLDADHAGCIDYRKSTSGGIQFLADKLVSWMSKKRNCTALCSCHVDENTTSRLWLQLQQNYANWYEMFDPTELEVLAKESA
nr:hypothetical protein [Tanacetum cinerariifolium]